MLNDRTSTKAISAVPTAKLSARLNTGSIVALALFTFILALEMLKTGAGGIAVLLKGLDVQGATNALGFGWLAAYLVMSGSPIAALSLALFGGGTLSPLETFAMINGSRLGASFIVLFTGFFYYLRGNRGRGVVSMGVLSMITTATIYFPAMLLGSYVLGQQWLAGVRLAPPRVFGAALDVVYGPIVETAATHLHRSGVFIIGLICLVIAFRLFDRALTPVDSDLLQTRWGRQLEHPLAMFALGLVVTSITLSVSVSLSVLVPLAGRGYVRREHVIPYIMGANISTFVDTLVAALLIQVPVAFTIVLTEMLAVAAVSVLVLATCYGPYHRMLLKLNALVTDSPPKFSLFVAFLGAMPLVLFLI